MGRRAWSLSAREYPQRADAGAHHPGAAHRVANHYKAKALDMFNKGEGGFKDRDLYVFCGNASDGILTAHPYLKGENLQDIKDKKGSPFGQQIMRTATEGKINEVTYWWPRADSDKPLEKHIFFTKVGDQICVVGYYKG
jgi:Single Cache domain 2